MHVPSTIQRPFEDAEFRLVHAGDVWLEGGRGVRESLRQAGIHPSARNRLICLAAKGRVMHIPGVLYGSRPVSDSPTDGGGYWITWEEKPQSV